MCSSWLYIKFPSETYIDYNGNFILEPLGQLSEKAKVQYWYDSDIWKLYISDLLFL